MKRSKVAVRSAMIRIIHPLVNTINDSTLRHKFAQFNIVPFGSSI